MMNVLDMVLFDMPYLHAVLTYYRRQIVFPDKVWHYLCGDSASYVDDERRSAESAKKTFGSN